jgi:hypothetical protein
LSLSINHLAVGSYITYAAENDPLNKRKIINLGKDYEFTIK